MDVQTIAAIVGGVVLPAIGGGIWLVRLEGRLNAHEAGCSERQKSHEARHIAQDEMIREMRTDIKTILRHLGQ